MSATRVEIATAPPYSVTIGAGVLADALELVAPDAGYAIVTDRNVLSHGHLERLPERAEEPMLLTLDPGEESKRLEVLEWVLEMLVGADLDRSSTLIALGGGVVGDLTGLAASLFMRGIDVIQCPTTLLAQVDASVGGKTAVNLEAGKNLAGTFHQPRAVYADVSMLETLPERELASGLGEVLKSALVGDGGLLDLLEQEHEAARAAQPDVCAAIVERCVRVKGRIVAADEREAGERKKLNLGHTFAHAIEKAAGYGTIPHGVAVATGTALALRASRELGLLTEPELPERYERLTLSLGLPPTLDALRTAFESKLRGDALLDALRHDKKGGAGEPRFVLPRAAGDVLVDQTVENALLQALLA